MSAETTQSPNQVDPQKKDSAIRKDLFLKDTSLLIGWISGLVIIAGLCWYFTQPLRNGLLIKAINRVLEQSGDSRRLAEALPSAPLGIGSWFTMTENLNSRYTGKERLAEGSRACVFVFVGEGSFFPSLAVVSPDGNVEEFISLTSHGHRMIKRVSPGILRIYISRIEGAEK